MAQFNGIGLRKFKTPQIRMMALTLGFRTQSRKITIIEQIVEYAAKSESHNQRVWDLFYVTRDGKSSTKSASENPSSVNPAEIEQLVKQELGRTKKELVNISDELDYRAERVAVKVATRLVEEMAPKILAEVAKTYQPMKIVIGSKSKKMRGVLPECFERMVQLGSQRINTMLVGPAGCGKTYIAAKMAEALNLEFSSISCSAGMSESQLAGWLLPVGSSGKFEYVPAPFVSMYENGGVFLLDEIDSADPNTLTFINKAIANDGFYVPQRHKKPYIKRHKDFVCIAAANTYGNGADALYVGRNQLDAATLDRFRAGMIPMDYDTKVEEALIDPDVLQWGRTIRQSILDNRLRRIMSTRVMIDLTKMKAGYKWGKKEWDESYFVDWSADERRRVGDRHVS